MTNEQRYLLALNTILTTGQFTPDRTGVGTISRLGINMVFDLSNNALPLLTTKKMPFHLIKSELLWMLSGSENIRPLLFDNNLIWSEWPFKKWVTSPDYPGEPLDFNDPNLQSTSAYKSAKIVFEFLIKHHLPFAEEWGSLGPVYGYNWRNWNCWKLRHDSLYHFDQLSDLIHNLKKNPFSRRHILLAWQPDSIGEQLLPSCIPLLQFIVRKNVNGEMLLSLLAFQRSGDMFLGVPWDIATYSLLCHMIAKECGFKADKFHHYIADAHIYNNHITQVNELLSREPFKMSPTVELNYTDSLLHSLPSLDQILLCDYAAHPSIKAQVAI